MNAKELLDYLRETSNGNVKEAIDVLETEYINSEEETVEDVYWYLIDLANNGIKHFQKIIATNLEAKSLRTDTLKIILNVCYTFRFLKT